MNILIGADVQCDPSSGAAGTELATIEGLRDLGHRVDTIWAANLSHRIKHGNLHYLLELPKSYRDVVRERLSKRNYDVIHLNQGHAYLAAKDIFKHQNKRVFVTRSHGLDDHMEKVLRPWRKRFGVRARGLFKSIPGYVIDGLLDRHIQLAAKYSSGFIVSSSIDRDYLIKHHHMQPEKVKAIAQAAPQHFLDLELKEFSNDRMRKILFIGSQYWKGTYTIVKTINRLAKKHRNFEFTWLGVGQFKTTAISLLDPDALEKTRFNDWVSQETLMAVYDTHGIFLCPSLFEGFCKVFLEAMSRGLCVIGTPTGGMREIVKDGKNGFIVNFDSDDDITSCIESIWRESMKAEKIALSARKTAKQFTWKQTAVETAIFYQSLLTLSVV